jgi:uncharacterized membrane protein
MSKQFSFSAQGTNPSSIVMIIGAFCIAIGWGAYTFGFSDGWFMIGLGIVFIFLGVFLNISWMGSRRR